MVLKNWPEKVYGSTDEATKEKAIQVFNTAVTQHVDTLEKHHMTDPNYKVSVFPLRERIGSLLVVQKVLILDNDGSPDRDTFIKDVHEEKERVVTLGIEKLDLETASIKQGNVNHVFDPKTLEEDIPTTPFPKRFDWNAAMERLGERNLAIFLDIAHTNVIRRYAQQATNSFTVDGGLPDNS